MGLKSVTHADYKEQAEAETQKAMKIPYSAFLPNDTLFFELQISPWPVLSFHFIFLRGKTAFLHPLSK